METTEVVESQSISNAHTTVGRKPVTLGMRLAGVAWAVMDLYAVGVIGFLLVRLVVRESWWLIAMLDNALQWALLPSFAFTAVAVWRKRMRRFVLYGSVALVFVFTYIELFLPRLPVQTACPADNPTCVTHLRVMQVNLFNNQFEADKMIPVLRNSGADIIAAEEFSAGPAAIIKQELSDVYPYQVQFGDYIPGIGLLSKYPITSAETLIFSENQFLPHILATLDVDGYPLRVIVAHPPPPRVDREGIFPVYQPYGSYDIKRLMELIDPDVPTLMPGDFNITDQSDDYRVIHDAGLRDAFREAGWGFGVTWPVGFAIPPLVRIDYIWMTQHFEASAAWVGEKNASDHFPVYADLVWRH